MNRIPGIPVRDWVVKNKLTSRSGYVALISIKFIKKVDKVQEILSLSTQASKELTKFLKMKIKRHKKLCSMSSKPYSNANYFLLNFFKIKIR